MRVAVFGATGDQGAAQVRALITAGHEPIAISRTAPPLLIDGQAIETCAVDLANDAAVARAVAMADALFVNLPSTSFQVAEPLIEAAARIASASVRARGIKMIVFNTSMPVAETKLGFAAQDARYEMRQLFFSSGLPTVSIQPVVFLDNLLKGWAWPSIAQQSLIVYPHRADLEVSWICHDDLAQLMISALNRPGLAGKSLAVGGAETVRLADLAAILSNAWQRTLGWRSQSIEEFAGTMRQVFAHTSTLDVERLVSELNRIYTWYNEAPERPFRVDMTPVLEMLPVHLTSIDAWARRQRCFVDRASGDIA